jgi:hypothetical protein
MAHRLPVIGTASHSLKGNRVTSYVTWTALQEKTDCSAAGL